MGGTHCQAVVTMLMKRMSRTMRNHVLPAMRSLVNDTNTFLPAGWPSPLSCVVNFSMLA